MQRGGRAPPLVPQPEEALLDQPHDLQALRVNEPKAAAQMGPARILVHDDQSRSRGGDVPRKVFRDRQAEAVEPGLLRHEAEPGAHEGRRARCSGLHLAEQRLADRRVDPRPQQHIVEDVIRDEGIRALDGPGGGVRQRPWHCQDGGTGQHLAIAVACPSTRRHRGLDQPQGPVKVHRRQASTDLIGEPRSDLHDRAVRAEAMCGENLGPVAAYRAVPLVDAGAYRAGGGWTPSGRRTIVGIMPPRAEGRDPRLWPVSDAATIRRFFSGLGKHVIAFAGYGELGYEREEVVREIALRVLAERAPSETVVHSGTLLRVGGHAGIAEVYSIARELGITTTGIHPSVAMKFGDTHRVSRDCQHVFFLEDTSWGGLLPGSLEPSPSLSLHLEVSHELVAIGGGKHAAEELLAFTSRGIEARYFAAEMNHATTLDWSARSGAGIHDLGGAAQEAWNTLRGARHLTR